MVTRKWLLVALLTTSFLVAPVEGPEVDGFSPAITTASGITLIVDFGNGTKASSTGLSGSNVLEVTEVVYLVEINWYGTLAFVTAIDGVSGTSDSSWQYWVNGMYASVACNFYELNNEDIIIWNRTASAYPAPTTNGAISDLLLGVVFVSIFGITVLTMLYLVVKERE